MLHATKTDDVTQFYTGWLFRVGRLASKTLLLTVVYRIGLGSSGNVMCC